MKKVTITVCVALVVLITLVSGCSKEKKKSTLLITEITTTTGLNVIEFAYDEWGKLKRLKEGDFTLEFAYMGDKLITRTIATMGVINKIDSIFYNTASQIIRIENYTPALIPTSIYFITYNDDGTVNTIVENDLTLIDNDKLAEYEMIGAERKELRKYIKVSGTYKLETKMEFLGYDDVKSPFVDFQVKQIPDYYSTYFFMICSPNNATSVKTTEYDLPTGLASNISSNSISYSYNSDGYPEKAFVDEGTSQFTLLYNYKTK